MADFQNRHADARKGQHLRRTCSKTESGKMAGPEEKLNCSVMMSFSNSGYVSRDPLFAGNPAEYGVRERWSRLRQVWILAVHSG